MSTTRIWIAGAVFAAVGAAVLLPYTSGAGENKALRDGIDKIAAALQKGDTDAAKKEADALAKKTEELVEMMDLFKPRKKDGFGIGPTPGAVAQDGIEQMIQHLQRDVPPAATLKKNSAALEQMAYRTAAMALITHAKPVQKAATGAGRKEWNDWANDMFDGSLKLAAAAKALGAQDVKTAAVKVNNSCNACHSKHR
jgi:hypothetical protein